MFLVFFTQKEFIQFCKTLSYMFHVDPEENELFQAIAKVTSLVLQIGEAGHRGETLRSEVTNPEDTKPAGSGDRSSEAEDDWTVSYAQILASLLTEQALVSFFENPANLSAKIAAAKENQYQQRASLLMLQQRTR